MPVLTPTAGGDFKRERINPGTYTAHLVSIQEFEMPDPDNPGQKLPRLRWGFQITSKKTGDIKIIEGITSKAWGAPVPGRQMAKAWKWVSAILKDTPPLEFDTDTILDSEVMVKISNKVDKQGVEYSFVEDVLIPGGEEDF